MTASSSLFAPETTRVALVTGASRGAGKGIALALGAAGLTVYVTGRSQHEGDAALPGTVQATADAVTQAGGQGIAVICDHGDDDQVAALFARVRTEQGRLDLLVNNACAIPDELTQPGPFWQKPLHMLDLLQVGMRSHYVASWHAAHLMAAQDSGLIVHTSSYGSVCYMHGPAYGAGKAAVDKILQKVPDVAVTPKVTTATVTYNNGIHFGAALEGTAKYPKSGAQQLSGDFHVSFAEGAGFQAKIDNVPVFDCHYGTSNGRYAIKIDRMLTSTPAGWLGESNE